MVWHCKPSSAHSCLHDTRTPLDFCCLCFLFCTSGIKAPTCCWLYHFIPNWLVEAPTSNVTAFENGMQLSLWLMKPQPSSSFSWGYGTLELPWVRESKSGQNHPKSYFPFMITLLMFSSSIYLIIYFYSMCTRIYVYICVCACACACVCSIYV